MLAFLVFKIEYRRALQQDATPALWPSQLSNLPPADPAIPDGTRPDCTREWSCRASAKPSISSFAAAFLPGSGKYVENDVTLSKQTQEKILPGATTPQFGSRMLSRGAPCGSRQGTALAVPSLACLEEESSLQFHYSFRADRNGFRVNPNGIHPERFYEGLAFARTLDPGAAGVIFGPFPTGLLGAFFATNSVRPRPFLTGSAPQTESSVTRSKQRL